MYRLEFSDAALASLQSIPVNTAKLIRSKLGHLAMNPRSPNNNVKKLKGRPGYRLRVGDWRVIYELRHERVIVHVLAIGPRGSIYD